MESLPTIDQATEQVGQWIELYNRSEHRGQGMDGAKPIEVWSRAASLRRADKHGLELLLQTRGIYRVGRNGVRFKVGSTVLTYGSSSAALRRYVGRDVCITLDPADCSYCMAFTAERKNRVRIDRLESNERIPANTSAETLRESNRTIRSRRKIMGQSQREAPAMQRNAAAEIRAGNAEAHKEALKATGTDDHRPNVKPVRTGFEGASKPLRTVAVSDRRERDLTQAAAAIFRDDRAAPIEEDRRLTLADLYTVPAQEDAGRDESMDAESPDRLRMVSGNWHERTE